MIVADTLYEVSAIKFFMSEYGVNPDGYTVVLKRKSGLHQTDGLTVPKDKKQYVIFLAPSIGGAELIRLIAHEVAHVCQIIKGDLEFANVAGSIKVFWHDEEVNVDKVPYRQRPWEIEAYTLEKKYVHEFIKKFGNQIQERLVQQDGEWVLLALHSDKVLKKFGKTKPSDETVKKEEARIQMFKHMHESKQVKSGDVVKIKKEWQDDSDDKITWVAVNDEEKGRVLIRNKYNKQPIPQTHLVQVTMLEGDKMKTFEEYIEESAFSQAPFAKVSKLEKHKDKLADKNNTKIIIDAIASVFSHAQINSLVEELK